MTAGEKYDRYFRNNNTRDSSTIAVCKLRTITYHQMMLQQQHHDNNTIIERSSVPFFPDPSAMSSVPFVDPFVPNRANRRSGAPILLVEDSRLDPPTRMIIAGNSLDRLMDELRINNPQDDQRRTLLITDTNNFVHVQHAGVEGRHRDSGTSLIAEQGAVVLTSRYINNGGGGYRLDNDDGSLNNNPQEANGNESEEESDHSSLPDLVDRDFDDDEDDFELPLTAGDGHELRTLQVFQIGPT